MAGRPYRDRREVGRYLAAKLAGYAGRPDVLVLALPRGGVPVAYEVALALENAALAELRARRSDRVLETNVEFWAAIVLDFAEVPASMFTSMFTCARTAGWAAHILEQKRTGRRPARCATYPAPTA